MHISAPNLSGGSLTASDLVSLSGTDSLTGTVTVNSPGDELDVAGALSVGGLITNNGLNVNGTGIIAGNIQNNGALGFYPSGIQAYASGIYGTGSVTVGGPGTVIFSGDNSGCGGLVTVVGGTLEVASPSRRQAI